MSARSRNSDEAWKAAKSTTSEEMATNLVPLIQNTTEREKGQFSRK